MSKRGLTIAILLGLAFICCDAGSTGIRRQLATDFRDHETYLEPAPRILPAPYTDAAPIVLPSDAVDDVGDVEPAGAIQPAPQIQPAPVILPSNAIKEKNRAYPASKRHGIKHKLQKDSSQARQAVQEILIIENQLISSTINRKPTPPNKQSRETPVQQTVQTTINSTKQAPPKLLLKQKQQYHTKNNRVKPLSTIEKHNNKDDSNGHKKDKTFLSAKRGNEKPLRKSNTSFLSLTDKHAKKGSKKSYFRNKNEKVLIKSFFLFPNLYFKKKKGILKKNGAKLYPPKLALPTPFHFTLKTTKTKPTTKRPTTKPTLAKPKIAKPKITKPKVTKPKNMKNEKNKTTKPENLAHKNQNKATAQTKLKNQLKKVKGGAVTNPPSEQKPREKNNQRVIPTQTSFIPEMPSTKKPDNGPLQKLIGTRPTSQIKQGGGCVNGKGKEPPTSQTGFQPEQTTYIPASKRPCKGY